MADPVNGVMSPYYTPPNATVQAQLLQQSNQQNQQNSSGGFMNPNTAGTIASKLVNGSFSKQVGQATNFLDNTVGAKLGFGTSGDLTGALPGASSAPEIASNAGALTGSDAAFAQSAAQSAGFDSTLGVAQQAQVMDAAAAPSTGMLGTTTTFSSALGSAGIGSAIGMGLEKLNVIGGNSTNATIGGAVGGFAGSALMGTTIGQALGSLIPIPGLGTIAGGVIGSWLGSQFGPKSPPTNADGWGANLNADGTLNNSTVSAGSKNAGPVTGFGQTATNQFSSLTQNASQELGIHFNPNLVTGVAISTKHPGPGGPAAIEVSNPTSGQSFDTGKIFYDPSNPQSAQNAELKALTAAAQQSGYTDTAKLAEWFHGQMDKATSTQNNSSGWMAPQSPNIPVSQSTFAQYMSKQGNNNVNSANPTPAI